MRVKDLVKELLELDQDATVLVQDSDGSETGISGAYHVTPTMYYEDDYQDILIVNSDDKEYIEQEFPVKEGVIILLDR